VDFGREAARDAREADWIGGEVLNMARDKKKTQKVAAQRSHAAAAADSGKSGANRSPFNREIYRDSYGVDTQHLPQEARKPDQINSLEGGGDLRGSGN